MTIVPCDLRRINRETIDFLKSGDKANLTEIQTEEPEDLPKIMADPNQIKQALLNVYLNAKQAVGSDGEIKSKIAVVGGKTVQITITDNGPGLSSENLRHAFEPFYTNRKGGTGLGLHVTQRIVEAHGGKIEIANTKPSGAAVKIEFPTTTQHST